MLSEMGSKLQVAIWVSSTPEHFLIHVHGTVHVIKKMILSTKFTEQVQVIEIAKLNWEIVKDVYAKSKKENKAKKEDNNSPAVAAAKAVLDKAQKTWD